MAHSKKFEMVEDAFSISVEKVFDLLVDCQAQIAYFLTQEAVHLLIHFKFLRVYDNGKDLLRHATHVKQSLLDRSLSPRISRQLLTLRHSKLNLPQMSQVMRKCASRSLSLSCQEALADRAPAILFFLV